MKTIGVESTKGGVGKTTFLFLLANAIHDRGSKIVLLDIDKADVIGEFEMWRQASQNYIEELDEALDQSVTQNLTKLREEQKISPTHKRELEISNLEKYLDGETPSPYKSLWPPSGVVIEPLIMNPGFSQRDFVAFLETIKNKHSPDYVLLNFAGSGHLAFKALLRHIDLVVIPFPLKAQDAIVSSVSLQEFQSYGLNNEFVVYNMVGKETRHEKNYRSLVPEGMYVSDIELPEIKLISRLIHFGFLNRLKLQPSSPDFPKNDQIDRVRDFASKILDEINQRLKV